jgi:hypothetical protein
MAKKKPATPDTTGLRPDHADACIAEIIELTTGNETAVAFVRELAEFFNATEVVLILRAAKEAKLLK